MTKAELIKLYDGRLKYEDINENLMTELKRFIQQDLKNLSPNQKLPRLSLEALYKIFDRITEVDCKKSSLLGLVKFLNDFNLLRFTIKNVLDCSPLYFKDITVSLKSWKTKLELNQEFLDVFFQHIPTVLYNDDLLRIVIMLEKNDLLTKIDASQILQVLPHSSYVYDFLLLLEKNQILSVESFNLLLQNAAYLGDTMNFISTITREYYPLSEKEYHEAMTQAGGNNSVPLTQDVANQFGMNAQEKRNQHIFESLNAASLRTFLQNARFSSCLEKEFSTASKKGFPRIYDHKSQAAQQKAQARDMWLANFCRKTVSDIDIVVKSRENYQQGLIAIEHCNNVQTPNFFQIMPPEVNDLIGRFCANGILLHPNQNQQA